MRSILLTALTAVVLSTVGCNRNIIDTTYMYDRAIIALPTGDVVEGTVKKWKDYQDGDQLQIEFSDGKIYLTHSSNVILIKD